MAIGTTAAILGSAAIGAVGSAIGGRSNSRAINRANDVNLQMGRENNALFRETRDMSLARLDPYANRGNVAGDAINALLGLSAPANNNAPAGTGGPMQAPSMPGAAPMTGATPPSNFGRNPRMDFMPQGFYPPQVDSPGAPGFQFGSAPGSPAPTQTVAPQGTTPQAAGSAFENFLNSAGARFQLDEGYKATNQGYAARGTLQSGAAMKALQDRGQQTMLNNYFLPYIGLLQGQQGVGMGAASATAGVGQSFANSVAGNNTNVAANSANAALARGANNNNMWAGIGSSFGNALGALGSSYGGGGSTGYGALDAWGRM